MSQWEGKSKGTVLGYRIFVFFIKNVGIKSAYVVLYFVATYYYIFLKKIMPQSFTILEKDWGFLILNLK